MSCDACKKVTTKLIELRSDYQTDDMKMICHECERSINSHLDKVRSVTNNIFKSLVKNFLKNRQNAN